MEPFNAGWLSLLPPAAAIVAALISREVISALLVGIFTGAVIYPKLPGMHLVPEHPRGQG